MPRFRAMGAHEVVLAEQQLGNAQGMYATIFILWILQYVLSRQEEFVFAECRRQNVLYNLHK